MRLQRLDLIAFGPFTDLRLDFSGGCEGLHFIYGPNEAGKTSSLRAIRQLFYGLEKGHSDFAHPYADVRVGGLLRHSDGSELEFVRRSGRAKALRGPQDSELIETFRLERILGNLDQNTFESFYSLDHDALVQGGRGILKGEGEVGELLFAASAGIANLRHVQNRLSAESMELYKPLGQKPTINKVLSDLKKTQATLRDLQLKSSEWTKQELRYQEAETKKVELDATIERKVQEASRLNRIRDALPAINRRREGLRQLESCRNVPLLQPNFSVLRRNCQADIQAADSLISNASANIDACEKKLGSIQVPSALLQAADQIEQLHSRLEDFRGKIKDFARNESMRSSDLHNAKEILKELGKEPDLTKTDEFQLRADETLTIRELANNRQGLIALNEAAEEKLHTLQHRQSLDQQTRELLKTIPELGELRMKIADLQKRGDLDDMLAKIQRDLRQAESSLEKERTRLPYLTQTLEALEQLQVPEDETINRTEAELEKRQDSFDKIRTKQSDLDDDLADLQDQRQELIEKGDVPSEEQLQAARQRRDDGWVLVREAWRSKQSDVAGSLSFRHAYPEARDLAEAFESSLRHVDDIADRLRVETDRVTAMKSLQEQERKKQKQRDRTASQVEEADAALKVVHDEWQRILGRLGLPDVTPKEFRAWLLKLNELLRKRADVRDRHSAVQEQRQLIENQRAKLVDVLSRLGRPFQGSGDLLQPVLLHAQNILTLLEGQRQERDRLDRELATRETEIHEANHKVTKVTSEVATWQADWEKAVARIGLTGVATPSTANLFLDRLREIKELNGKVRGFESRNNGIRRDNQEFEQDVARIVTQVIPDLSPLPADRAVLELQRELTEARQLYQQFEGLQKELAKETDTRQNADTARKKAESALNELLREAGCTSADELPEIERRSALRSQLERDDKHDKDEILRFSGSKSLVEFVEEASAVNADEIAARIDHLNDEIRADRQEMSTIDQHIAIERDTLSKMDGSAAAADAAIQSQELVAKLRVEVTEFAVLLLADNILRNSIERFRKKHQDPILTRAGKLFADLTAGSFSGLQTDYDDDGRATLCGVRPGTQRLVGVAGMSDGSCDQLYLALRLASLQHSLESREAIPFIVDDILLNFDNFRAVAALKALAALSEQTQVFFFTHHEHLLDLAQKNLPKDRLFVHRLERKLNDIP